MEVTIAAAAVLFDMDGVLVDSLACISQAWLAWAQSHGLDGEGTLALGHGRTTLDHIRLVAPHLANAREVARVDSMEARFASDVRVQPGARALTTALNALSARWGVVTSAGSAAAAARLSAAGIEPPAVMVTTEDVERPKPAPDGYLLGCARLGAAPARAVVFEDAPAGIEAAHAAHIRVVALATTHEAAELSGADWIVADLAHVVAAASDDSGGLAIRLRLL